MNVITTSLHKRVKVECGLALITRYAFLFLALSFCGAQSQTVIVANALTQCQCHSKQRRAKISAASSDATRRKRVAIHTDDSLCPIFSFLVFR